MASKAPKPLQAWAKG